MTAYVDANNCSVRDGDNAWPFAIDCHDGSVRIVLDNSSYQLHPLAWREKRNLARFAHLGEQFLQTQFLRTSLGASLEKSVDTRASTNKAAELPASAEHRAALSVLARWLNAPDGNFGLPLDQQLLASVTLDICRNMQLAPTAFDTLAASDVEILWQATRANAPAPTQNAQPIAPVSGKTRIVVLPDDNKENSKSEINTRDNSSIPVNADLSNKINDAKDASASVRAESSKNSADELSRPPSTIDRAPFAAIGSTPLRAAGEIKKEKSKNRFRINLAAPVAKMISTSFATNAHSAAQTEFAPSEFQHADFSAQPHALDSMRAVAEVRAINANAQPSTSIVSMALPQDIAKITPNADVISTPQLAEQFIELFAERLHEAAALVGIDVES
ncbi:MAG: hypothetical protein JWM78_2125 [Verrucomicrobiaceae bacterium]|nr:hypothetical protein [Verrucomicrobiaceae bacterium]